MTERRRSRARAVGAAGVALALTSLHPGPWMTRLFPPPTYEMPNDLLFEVTGILKVLPAAMAAHALRRNR